MKQNCANYADSTRNKLEILLINTIKWEESSIVYDIV